MRSSAFFVAALLAVTSGRCFAWGEAGHQVVGSIAFHYLSHDAKAAVRELLGDEALSTAGLWADQIRIDPDYRWAAPLHYVNVPRGATEVDLSRDCAEGLCVLGAIDRYAGIVRDESRLKAERVEALRFLIHFVGDIHQPLHVSHADDRGGNMITLTGFDGRRTNLHRAWDTDLIEHRMRGGWPVLAADIRQSITDEELERWRASKHPITWANESLTITHTLYADLPDDARLDQVYYDRHIGTIEDRLATAGVRLAATLDDLFAQDQPAAER